MKELIEIRIHSRGGSGGKTAGQLIAEAALAEKKWIQTFPEYGPERMGAPVQTYVKISNKKILSYSSIKHAEIVLVIDESLIDEKVVENISDSCVLIVNTDKNIKNKLEKLGFKGYIYCVNATKIAFDTIGKNIPNSALIGALIKVSNETIIKLKTLNEIIIRDFSEKGDKIVKANLEAVKRSYNEVKKY